MLETFGGTNLGCYGERPVRGGVAPSPHSHGAAFDWRYARGSIADASERELVDSLVLLTLIRNSAELHIQAIHDYTEARIWRAGRTQSVDDSEDGWWRPQPHRNGMGSAWAAYLHIETTQGGWGDETPLLERA